MLLAQRLQSSKGEIENNVVDEGDVVDDDEAELADDTKADMDDTCTKQTELAEAGHRSRHQPHQPHQYCLSCQRVDGT